MIKRIHFAIFSILLAALFISLIHHTASAAASNQPDITTFTIQGGNGNAENDANGNTILKSHQTPYGFNLIKLNASLNGRTAELPVGSLIILYFPNGSYKVTINPDKGVVEGAKGTHNLPDGDIGLLKVVGQGTVTITVTKTAGKNTTTNAANTKYAWSGYKSTGTTYTDITSNWTVPTASTSSTDPSYASAWVGIDDGTDGNGDIIQTGTESLYVSGSASYIAWWEIGTGNAETVTCSNIHAGDSMFAEIKKNTSDWTITLKDLTQNLNCSPTNNQTYSGPQSSAEWIIERPTVGGVLSQLANYGSVTFSNDTQNAVNPQHSYSTDSIDMLADDGVTIISTTSNPNSLTDAFTVQYGSTQPAAPASWSNVSPTGSTYDKIYSMAASSTSSVWAAGYEYGYYGRYPVTYHNNGSGWTKYSPPIQVNNDHYLYGIASSSSGDAWTVGHDYSYPHWVTLAYHWNGSSWVHVTSDSPASNNTNYLYSVAIDSSGTPWAVGLYYTSAQQPLLEKWNGTKFAQQTLSLPSGYTYGQLNSVAFSSSTNGWAVGMVGNSSSSTYVIYHYDGTSWSSYTLGSSKASLNSVAIVSDNEAWAVGTQGTSNNTPLILHYTTSGWNEDTSFNGYYPNSATLNSVGTDGASDVWIAGYWYNGAYYPYTMHYNGSNWTQVSTPSVSGNAAYLQGVAVNSNEAWAGGYYIQTGHTSSQPSPLVFQSF